MAAVPRAAAHPGARTVGPSVGIPAALFGALVLIAVTATGLLQVLQTTRTTNIGYELRALEAERATLAAEVRLLEADIATMSRIDEVRRRAIESLGMVEPEQTLYIAVIEPAPAVIPLPERYVSLKEQPAPDAGTWWEQLLSRLPGFN
ncbi:MAG: hypothetical protein QF664_01180 [Dehalococcoidia bacterium]|jgi:cell division protein FtsL|nr:hypothetical protein [Dehalococcoidia bacterium]